MLMRNLVLGFCLAVFAGPSFAIEIEKVDVPDTITVHGKTLKLNGSAIRLADRFGLTFKVYVGALYAEKTSTDASALLNSEDVRSLKMTFLRRVGKDDVTEPVRTGVIENCKGIMEPAKCEPVRAALKPLLDKMPDMFNKSTIQYYFFKDRVEFEVNGREKVKGTLTGAEVSKSLLALWLGHKPPSAKMKEDLLGASSKK
ncbi:MAG: chalcone isomerase family protein [Bdellovibrionales bacterium]